MSGDINFYGANGSVLPLDSLPKPVLQEIYYAVTGKTENLSALLRGNVVIAAADFGRLHDMLIDQLSVHHVILDPTVTIVVKHENGRSETYSSWARFQSLRVSDYEITSELILRFEFVLQLPQTSRSQRCTIDVNLDSSLPLIRKRDEPSSDFGAVGLSYFFTPEWRTAKISIDFVDFLVAKSFSAVVEEWFKTLSPQRAHRLDQFLLRKQVVLSNALHQLGRLGMAAFLAAYASFGKHTSYSLSQLTLAVSFGLTIWAVAAVFEIPIAQWINGRVWSNVVPSVILLTEADKRAYAKIVDGLKSPHGTLAAFAGAVVTAIATNIFASYLYTYLTAK